MVFCLRLPAFTAMDMPQNEANENRNLWIKTGKGASHSYYRGVANLIHFTAGRTPRGLKRRTLNRHFCSNQHPRKPIITFRDRPLIACTAILALRSGDYAKIVSTQQLNKFWWAAETRTPDPLIKSQIQRGPEPNIDKKAQPFRGPLGFFFDNGTYMFCPGSGTG